jgi:parallel beta-helix repeat protein
MIKIIRQRLPGFAIAALALLGATSSWAAATVNLSWDGNPANLNASFAAAQAAAGDGGRINLAARDYSTNQAITINRQVRIVGLSRDTSIVRRTDTIYGAVFNVTADNVEFNALHINGGVITPKDGTPDRIGVLTNGKSNIKLIGSTISHVNYGVFNGAGQRFANLLVSNTHFLDNHNYGLWLWSNDAQPQPLASGRFVFEKSYIAKDGLMGINVDFGNESGNKLTTIDVSSTVNGVRNNAAITDNYIDPAREFGVAIARASNITISGNNVRGGGGKFRADFQSGAKGEYTQAIHLEDRSGNLVVRSNTIANYHNGANGVNLNSAMNVFAVSAARATYNVLVENNTFVGNTRWAMELHDNSDVTVRNNNFSGIITSGNKIDAWRGVINLLLQGNTALTRAQVSGSGNSLPAGGSLNPASSFL